MILDFTSIRNLYKAADTKTVAFLLVKEGSKDEHDIAHLTFRRTFGTRERIAFEIDHYDWHWVPKVIAEEDAFVWRLNMLGGGRLVGLSQRLRRMATLKSFIQKKSLRFAEGFMLGHNQPQKSFLTGMRYLPPEGLTDDGIDEKQIGKVEDTEFQRPRDKSVYQPPIILIRKNERLQMGFWDDGALAFTSTLVAIGGTTAQRPLLKKMYTQIMDSHRTYRLACMMHGSKAFVAKATAILKQDISVLPFPENPSELRLSFWERAIEEDTLDYFSDFVRLGQNSELLLKAANPQNVDKYSALFCKMLVSVYDNLKADAPIFLDGLICQPFYFGDKPTASVLAQGQGDALRTLIYHKHHESLRTVRMLRFYIDNVILIVKPDRLRFWIRSTAIRDADETIISLKEQGY